MAAFGAVPNLSLAVEHGFTYRIKGGPWQHLITGVDTSWRTVAASVMSSYCARTHGAYVLSKGSSIAWNYQESDPEFGVMQAKEVQMALQQVLAAFPVVIRTGKGYVEACLKDVNKGTMAAHFVDIIQGTVGTRPSGRDGGAKRPKMPGVPLRGGGGSRATGGPLPPFARAAC